MLTAWSGQGGEFTLEYGPSAAHVWIESPAKRSHSSIPTVGFNMKKVTKGHVTLKWYVYRPCTMLFRMG